LAIIPNEASEELPILPESVAVTMPDLPLQLRLTTVSQFKAISDPIRSKILGIIQNQPTTAKQIADKLGATPGAIGHHLHVLETAGLAQVVACRLIKGIVARYYTRTARLFEFAFPPDITGEEPPMSLNIITKARDELAQTLNEADSIVRYTGFPHAHLNPDRVEYYEARLLALVEEFLQEESNPANPVFGLAVALFQAPAYLQTTN
jgi:DNA-binding transcriptional ArsR family regulator